ncbi:MAG: NuoI/complex I 23 kDa subunit family protein [Actinomycetes bacterium]
MAPTTIPGAGLLKGLGITLKTMLKPASTQQYPHVRPELPPRTRGVIALMEENCTVCMLCSRECPDWCIYIDSHKETVPPATEGGRARTRNVLDRFAIDFALCMYCGICIEVCPFDALWWSPEFEYAEYDQRNLLHEKEKLREWADTVLPPPPLEEGADQPAEVADALSKHEAELEKARQKELEAAEAKEQAKVGGAAPAAAKPVDVGPRPTIADIELEGETQIDQAVFDQMVADGKSERMARAKAKAAWVKAEKAKLLDQAVADWEKRKAEAEQAAAAAPAAAPAGDGGGAAAPAAEARPKPTLADIELEGEPQVDQAVFDQMVADGKSERMARAKAKAAWVKAEKQKLLDDAIAAWEAEQAAAAPATAPAAADAGEAPAEPAQGDARQLADVHVEGAGEIDQETYDALIAEGKSERIARAKAKAAWVKKRKQELLEEEGQ